MTPFESDALKGASSETAREMKPFIEAVMELRKMPDVPKNPVDEADMLEAFREWNPDVTMDERRWAFEAGWRAAMAEVKKKFGPPPRPLSLSQGPGATRWCNSCTMNPDNGCRNPLGPGYCPYRREVAVDKPRYDHSREGF